MPCSGYGLRCTPSYPDVFIQTLAGFYTDQNFGMSRLRLRWETVTLKCADGKNERLPLALSTYTPQVLLLLLEGANDLVQGGASAIQVVADALEAMAGYARGRGIEVFLGTLLPQRAGASGRAVKDATLIPQTNDKIRVVATKQQVTLVDLYQAFGGFADPRLIDSDGLHPTPDGHKLIARTFYEAVKARLAVPPSSPTILTMRPSQ